MSKNDTIRKSDKKFIRTEKARIRREFSDVKKQEELINQLYKSFIKLPQNSADINAEVRGNEKKEKLVKEVKAEKPKAEKVKKEKVVKKSKSK